MARKEEVRLDRRELLMLGLAGASSLVLGKASSVLAAEKKGKETKVIKEAESFVPGFAKIRLREVTWQPGGMEGERPMPNAMVCECTAGSFEATVDGKTITRKKGDIWTCKPGQVISDVNKGKTVAVMRIFDLLPA
jgi:quercetin dioxygenase-like cupin family protein